MVEHVDQCVFQLTGFIEGVHYELYNKSSTEMSECPDNTIALTITSPPYWNAINYETHLQSRNTTYRTRDYVKFGSTFDEYIDNTITVFREVLRVTLPGGLCCIITGTLLFNGSHYPIPMILTVKMLEIGWVFKENIIWHKVIDNVPRCGAFVKDPLVGNYYPNVNNEHILIFQKEGHKNKDRKLKSEMEIDELFVKEISNNVWHIITVCPGDIDHPCPFPQELVRRLLLLYSNRGEIILDPFLGSGQTAIVAVNNGRKCIGYEVEEKYIQYTKSRLGTPIGAAPRNFMVSIRQT